MFLLDQICLKIVVDSDIASKCSEKAIPCYCLLHSPVTGSNAISEKTCSEYSSARLASVMQWNWSHSPDKAAAWPGLASTQDEMGRETSEGFSLLNILSMRVNMCWPPKRRVQHIIPKKFSWNSPPDMSVNSSRCPDKTLRPILDRPLQEMEWDEKFRKSSL